MPSQSDADFTPRRYEVRHVTTYAYEGADVTSCYERGILAMRDTPTQVVREHGVQITPEPDLVTEHVDAFGNHSYYVEIATPHRELVVAKHSLVDVDWPRADLAELDRMTVGEAAAAVAAHRRTGMGGLDGVALTTLLLPSDLVAFAPQVRDYGAAVLAPDRPVGTAVLDLCRTIFADFTYRKGVTSTRTTLPELLERRAGVCQDFAHLAVGCLRLAGLPARYVSGYIETLPPPGKVKLAGSDASHAWASVAIPSAAGDVTWVDLDPTNDHLADSRYLVTAWGRDYRDVSPLRGIISTEASSSSLKVAVDVIRR